MNDIQHCPDACKVRLRHLEEHQKEHTHEGLWEEIRMKLSQKIFFWVMGITVVILLATFGAIYRQGGMTLEKVQAAQVEQAKIQEALRNHTETQKAMMKRIHERGDDSG